jgi:transposase
VVRRHELTDEQWQVIEPLLPPPGTKGRPRVDDRRVINGMLFKAKTGVAWRDLPERYGLWKTVYNRFWRWSRNGTLTDLVKHARVIAEAIDELDREVAIDSSIVRAHQHAAGARRQATNVSDVGADETGTGQIEPDDHAIGRSRGGPTTKIHLAADGHGRPLVVLLTGGNVNDCTRFEQVDQIEFPHPGPGPRASRPSRVLADKGYSSRGNRADLRRRHIPATIPERADQQANRAAAAVPEDARPPSTRSPTSAAASSNAASTGTSSTGLSPPATTRPPCPTRP